MGYGYELMIAFGFVFGVVGIAMVIGFWLLARDSVKGVVGITVLTFVALGLLAMGITGAVLYHNCDGEECQTEIASLNYGGLSTSGQFFLGAGTVDSEPVYVYMEETQQGYVVRMIKCRQVYLREDDSKTPGIYLVKEKGSSGYQVIYVPVGTLMLTYNVNTGG